jgi:hypothetical protein
VGRRHFVRLLRDGQQSLDDPNELLKRGLWLVPWRRKSTACDDDQGENGEQPLNVAHSSSPIERAPSVRSCQYSDLIVGRPVLLSIGVTAPRFSLPLQEKKMISVQDRQ